MSRITDAVEAVSNAIISQRDYLTDLDREIGDGDHGINMARGFTAVKETIEAMDDDKDPKKILDAIGETLIMNVGGAAGPLFGSAFKRQPKHAKAIPRSPSQTSSVCSPLPSKT